MHGPCPPEFQSRAENRAFKNSYYTREKMSSSLRETLTTRLFQFRAESLLPAKGTKKAAFVPGLRWGRLFMPEKVCNSIQQKQKPLSLPFNLPPKQDTPLPVPASLQYWCQCSPSHLEVAMSPFPPQPCSSNYLLSPIVSTSPISLAFSPLYFFL